MSYVKGWPRFTFLLHFYIMRLLTPCASFTDDGVPTSFLIIPFRNPCLHISPSIIICGCQSKQTLFKILFFLLSNSKITERKNYYANLSIGKAEGFKCKFVTDVPLFHSFLSALAYAMAGGEIGTASSSLLAFLLFFKLWTND